MEIKEDTPFDIKLEKSKEIIRKVEKQSKHPLIINFSGGKDSSCLLHLVRDTIDREPEAVFMESSIDLPGNLEHVKRIAEKEDIKLHTTHPARDYYGNYPYWVRKFGYFPTINATWCVTRLKQRPARAYFREIYGYDTLYKLNGVRQYESGRRKKLYSARDYVFEDYEHSGSYMVCPLKDWTTENRDKYIQREDIEIHPAYKVCGVSGCYMCPYYQSSILEAILKKYPNLYDGVIELENELDKPAGTGYTWIRDLKKKIVG